MALLSLEKLDRWSDDEILRRVLYRDGLILVVDKPSGLAVHKAGPCRHNLEQYFYLLTFGLKNPPVLAHRLDRLTSGCLVLARHAKAARTMQELFANGRIKKTYYAWVHGVVAPEQGRIDQPLTRQSSEKSNWRMKTDLSGQPAITDFSVAIRLKTRTLLKLNPLTGRTHQLRVHCQAMGHPIIGDNIYGQGFFQDPMLHLHAHQIEIPLYRNKPAIVVTAPWPGHMQNEACKEDYYGASNNAAQDSISSST